MPYPNSPFWSALEDGKQLTIDDKLYRLSVVDCGKLVAPYGQLLACDPFTSLGDADLPVVAIPPGAYPVFVTLADVSGSGDGSHIREAYATLMLDMEFVGLDRTLAQASAEIAADRAVKGADAVYIAVAHSSGSTLVTLDQEQSRRATPIVEVMTPQEALAALS